MFLEHRRAERALASVVATSYLLGVSTHRWSGVAALETGADFSAGTAI